MSQSATAPPPPPPAQQAAVAAAAPSPATDAAAPPDPAPAVVDTPGLLNRWQLIGMSIAIVFGLLSALLQFLGWQADGRSADDTEQLVRVQGIQSDLLRADALATTAFLQGGLEDPGQRKEYDDTVDAILGDIADAAEAQPADRKALADLNVAVTDYATAVAQARTNNRLGYPVGAMYLSDASAALRTDAIPILEALVSANSDRAEGSMDSQHPWWLLLVGILALVGLWWVNRQVAQHFRRRINVGIAVAAGVVLLVSVVTIALAAARDGSNGDLRDGSFRAAVDQAEVRTAANDAKANESLRLINRGSGDKYEDPWRALAKSVDGLVRSGLGDSWDDYKEGHEQIVQLDDGGAWEQAVALATKQSDYDPEKEPYEAASDGSSAPLDAFDADAKDAVKTASDDTVDELRGGRWFAFTLVLATLLLGVVAAAFVARGIGERRREYA